VVEEFDFASWYRREHPRVVSSVAAITGRPSVTADSADEAFVRTWERWDRLRRTPTLAAWVHRAALKAARSRVRRADRDLRRVRAAPPSGPAGVEPAPSGWPEGLWVALQAMTPRQRQAIVLRHVADLSLADVATTMGVAPARAQSSLDAAHARVASLATDGEWAATAPGPPDASDADG
jgi:DNA-directed RNA polymerase specialized sigma24 family protein